MIKRSKILWETPGKPQLKTKEEVISDILQCTLKSSFKSWEKFQESKKPLIRKT
jgi:hypothetical protein